MTLIFKDDLIDKFKINQRYAVAKAEANFHHFTKGHIIKYRQVGENKLEIDVYNTEEQLNERHPTYKTGNPVKGKALIINNIKFSDLGGEIRYGTVEDQNALVDVFENDLKFEVIVKINQTQKV